MVMNGWYPDPGGEPGRFRYWDGQAWSTETTDNPRTPPPAGGRPAGSLGSGSSGSGSSGSGAPVPGSTGNGRSRRGLLILVAAVVVIIAVIAGVALLGPDSGAQRAEQSRPGSTESGWDDSSPLPTATPSPTPSPSSTEPPDSAPPTGSQDPSDEVPCPQGFPDSHAEWPNDGRVHGGGLSFAPVSSYPGAETDGQFSWMTDVMSQTQVTEPSWISIFAVGQVSSTEDGFTTAKEAVESSMQCAITEGWYREFSGRKDLENAAITIDGRRGWILRSEIRVDRDDLSVDGDQLTFVAVDTGRKGSLAMWCGMVPLGDTARLQIDRTVLAGLRAE